MLVQLLSVGRSIVLPSNALGGAMAAVYASGAYARIRRQFNLPIGKFHGVGEALARMAGNVYIMTAASRVTCTALTTGEKPAVPSAILKYHNTELGRQVANDAMDVHGGKAIMLGPKNYLARGYEVRADRDHGRGREHPDAQFHHLRPGCDPLPSVRPRRDGSGEGRGSRARPRRIRSAAVQAHGLHAVECGALAGCRRSRSRASPTFRATGATASLLPAHQPVQRVVRADHGRRDAHARRRAEAP